MFERLTDEMELIYNLRPQDRLNEARLLPSDNPAIRDNEETEEPRQPYYTNA